MKLKLYVVFCLMCVMVSFGADTTAANLAKWTGDLNLGVAWTSGNTDTMNLSFSFNANKKFSSRLEWKNKGSFLYNKTNDVLSAESLGATSRINWSLSKRFYLFGELHGNRDVFKDYYSQLIPGIGAGFNIIAKKKVELSLHGGLSQIITRYKSDNRTDNYIGLRFGNHFLWKFSSFAELKESAEFTENLENRGGHLFKYEVKLSASLARNWALSVTLNHRFDSNPSQAHIKKGDTQLITGVTHKF